MATRPIKHLGQTVFEVSLLDPDIVYIELLHYQPGYMRSLAFAMIQTMLDAHPDVQKFFVVFNFNTRLEPDMTFTMEDSKDLEEASAVLDRLFYIVHDIQVISEHNTQAQMNRVLTERSLLKKVYTADTVEEAMKIAASLRQP